MHAERAGDKGSNPQLEARIWEWLSDLRDPEIPVLTLLDLGIIRFVRVKDSNVNIGIAPTYTGCPATEVIASSVVDALRQRGIERPNIEQVLTPPWTTDWISTSGREKLVAYGIAPPAEAATSKRALLGAELAIACPRCSSTDTIRVSQFGSTPCKASFKCGACLEPFEYFKCL